MEKQFVTTSENPKVFITVHGDLRLKGADEYEVAVKAPDQEEVTLEQDGDQVTVRCESECQILVPREARVEIVEVHGNAVLKAFEGEVNIQEVHGNLDSAQHWTRKTRSCARQPGSQKCGGAASKCNG